MRIVSTAISRKTRWRLRLRAGVLAFAFAAITGAPWAHVLTADGHGGHACCGAAATPLQTAAPAFAAVHADQTCWFCQNLFSLTHHTVAAAPFALTATASHTPFFARAPQAPVIRLIDPAARAQAPPARA